MSRPLVFFRGEDAAEKFVRDLQLEAKQLFDEYIAAPKPKLLTATESRSLVNTTICHMYKTNAAYCYRITIVSQYHYLSHVQNQCCLLLQNHDR